MSRSSALGWIVLGLASIGGCASPSGDTSVGNGGNGDTGNVQVPIIGTSYTYASAPSAAEGVVTITFLGETRAIPVRFARDVGRERASGDGCLVAATKTDASDLGGDLACVVSFGANGDVALAIALDGGGSDDGTEASLAQNQKSGSLAWGKNCSSTVVAIDSADVVSQQGSFISGGYGVTSAAPGAAATSSDFERVVSFDAKGSAATCQGAAGPTVTISLVATWDAAHVVVDTATEVFGD